MRAQQHNWVLTKKHQALFGLRKNKQQPSVKRTQFSLTLSWACTAHKVQGLSLAEGVVSLDLSSMNKMYLIGSYNKTALKVNESEKKEYERSRNEGLFKSKSHLAVTETSITITLLNTHSLKLHVLDIAMYDRLLDNEARCEARSDTSIIESALQKKYTMHFNNSDNKFRSIAYDLSNDVEILAKEDFNGISIFNFRKQHFSNNPFSIALTYRCPNTQT